jgi:hypothetical protein
MTPPSVWFKHQEGTTRAIARKLRIFAGKLTWLWWLWRLEVPNQLARAFVNADNGVRFVVGLHVQI